MVFSWPVKQPIRCYEERLRPDETLVTKLRSIDTFLPVAKGGTFCVPGPFGAGKTVLQHMEAKTPTWMWSSWRPAASGPARWWRC